MKRIFVINPGCTSTKVAVYEDENPVWTSDGLHDPAEIDKFSTINEQYEYRKDFVLNLLKEAGIPLKFDAVIGRGGLLKPLQGGVYAINELMKKDLWNAKHQHVCNLGSLIADEIAHECHCPAFMADPVVVDEMMTRARYTGLPFMKRESIFHALNAKAASRRYARSIGKHYEELNLVMKMLSGNAGCQALLGMKDMREIERHALAGEQPFAEVLEAMLYTVSKQIGAMAVALWGKADAIILTGGIAHSKYCVEEIKKQVEFLAPVVVLPGEGEMRSLAFNALGALNGELPIQEYV